jgi:hypothetical protein
MDTIIKTVGGAVAGLLMGWAGTAMTLVGDVSALKASMARIETRLDALVIQGARK